VFCSFPFLLFIFFMFLSYDCLCFLFFFCGSPLTQPGTRRAKGRERKREMERQLLRFFFFTILRNLRHMT
jgi:hypothetical protein